MSFLEYARFKFVLALVALVFEIPLMDAFQIIVMVLSGTRDWPKKLFKFFITKKVIVMTPILQNPPTTYRG